MGREGPTLNIPQNADILTRDKVDCDALTAESARTSDAVDVVLAVAGQVVVDARLKMCLLAM